MSSLQLPGLQCPGTQITSNITRAISLASYKNKVMLVSHLPSVLFVFLLASSADVVIFS